MANRFTDTEKWKDEWFLTLEPMMKIFWLYMCDTCDSAGVWRVNFHLASFSVGTILDKQSALSAMGDRVQVISHEKWFIPKFITYQYRGKLSFSNNAHRGALKLLDYHGIETRPYLDPSKGQATFGNDSLAPKDKDKDKDKDKEKEKGKESTNVKTETNFNKWLGCNNIRALSADEKPVSVICENALKGDATVDKVIELYNQELSGVGQLKMCIALGSKSIKELLNTFSHLPTMSLWLELFGLVKANTALTGLSKTVFLATLDWLVKEDNALNVLAGKYDLPDPVVVNEKSIDDYVKSIKLEA